MLCTCGGGYVLCALISHMGLTYEHMTLHICMLLVHWDNAPNLITIGHAHFPHMAQGCAGWLGGYNYSYVAMVFTNDYIC